MRPALLSLAASLLFLVPGAGSLAAQEGVSGTWVVTVAAAEMGLLTMEFDLDQSGVEVTGTARMELPEIEGTRITDGVFRDGILSFLLHVGAQGQWYVVAVEAEVTGDEMSGEAAVPELGMATPFTAVRQGG